MNPFDDSMLFRIHRATRTSEAEGGRALLSALQWKTQDGEIAPSAFLQTYWVTWDSNVTSDTRRALERLHLSGLMYGVVEVVARGDHVVLHLPPSVSMLPTWAEDRNRLLRLLRAEFPHLIAAFVVAHAAAGASSQEPLDTLRWTRVWLARVSPPA